MNSTHNLEEDYHLSPAINLNDGLSKPKRNRSQFIHNLKLFSCPCRRKNPAWNQPLYPNPNQNFESNSKVMFS